MKPDNPQPDIFNRSFWISETDPVRLREGGQSALEQAGFLILGFNEHHFSPQGYTALWLLGESHLAIHTFPEKGKTYVELTSCSKEKLDSFCRISRELFRQMDPTFPKTSLS